MNKKYKGSHYSKDWKASGFTIKEVMHEAKEQFYASSFAEGTSWNKLSVTDRNKFFRDAHTTLLCNRAGKILKEATALVARVEPETNVALPEQEAKWFDSGIAPHERGRYNAFILLVSTHCLGEDKCLSYHEICKRISAYENLKKPFNQGRVTLFIRHARRMGIPLMNKTVKGESVVWYANTDAELDWLVTRFLLPIKGLSNTLRGIKFNKELGKKVLKELEEIHSLSNFIKDQIEPNKEN